MTYMSNKEKKDANKKEIEYQYVKRQRKGWVLPLVIVLMLIVGLVYFFFINDVELPISTGNSTKVEDEKHDDFLAGLRLAALERYEEAVSYFDKVRFNNLDENDKEIIIHAYIMAGKEQKALDLSPESDAEVIRKLLRFNELEKLLELETESELVAFEIAILEQDYEKIVEYKDVEGLVLDARIANEISNAYYQLGEKEEAVNFTSLMTFDDINVWSNEWTGTQRVETKTEVITKHSVLHTLLVLALLGMILFIIYTQYRNGLFLNKSVVNESAGKQTKDEESEIRQKRKKSLTKKKRKKQEKGEESQTDDKYSYYFDE